MKKAIIAGIMAILVILSAFTVLADSSDEDLDIENFLESDQGNGFRAIGPLHHFKVNWPKMTERAIYYFIDEFDLDEDDTIGDLLDSLEEIEEEAKENHVDHISELLELDEDPSDEEILEAWREHKLDNIIEHLGLDEDASPEDVIAAIREARHNALTDNLGLDDDATIEETDEALKGWGKENKPAINGFFYMVRNAWKHGH